MSKSTLRLIRNKHALLVIQFAPMSFTTTPPIVSTFDNGLTVILAPMETRSVSVLAMVGTGSRYEEASTNGISHFLEHMVFKGTAKYPTPKILAETLDKVGAEVNAFTSKEYTGYYVKSASEYVNLGLDVVSELLLTPLLPAKELEREKGVIVEEIHMYEDNPARHVDDLFEQMAFAGSPLGRPVIGTPSTVRSFDQDTFLRHLHAWYGLSNVVLAIAGDKSVVTKKLLKEVEKAFGKAHPEREQKLPEQVIASITGNSFSTKGRLHVEYKDTQQSHFILAFEGLNRSDPDQYSADILGTLLGGTMSSRLFNEVREKRGLCYYVHANDDYYHDVGIFGASAGVDPTRVEEAVKVIREQLQLVAQDSGEFAITPEEVTNAQNHAVGSSILHLEDSMAIAKFYASRKLLRNEIILPEEQIERIKAVRFEEVQSVAKRLCRSNKIYFTIIGPHKTESIFSAILDA